MTNLWHPFKVNMTADTVLKMAKARQAFRHRVARNKIIGWADQRMYVEWYFHACTLEIRYDRGIGAYTVYEIKPPVITGERFTTKKAALTHKEVEAQMAALNIDGKTKNRLA